MNKLKTLLVIGLVVVFMSVGLADVQAAAVRIHRDSFGVPHIYADSIEGLFYGWGYATAQDRLFQLEMLKRTYFGQIAELYGPEYFDLDLFWLREYPRQEALMEEFSNLDRKYQVILLSYADGINAWIDEVRKDSVNKLPYEFYQLGIYPEYFDVTDIAAAIMATLGLFMDLNNELLHLEVYAHLLDQFGDKADDYFNDMVWVEDPSAYTTIFPEDLNGKTYNYSNTRGNQLSQLNLNGLKGLAEQYPKKSTIIENVMTAMGYPVSQKIGSGSTESMSYVVVVGGEMSESGKPWLFAGPQVDFFVPGLVYEVGLHGAGFDTVGTALIGGPYLMFGANTTAAYSTTASGSNISDIYEERINPANPRQYWFNGQWVDMDVRTHYVKVKGESEPRVVDMYFTVHGPVIAEVDTNGDGKIDIAYTKKVACNDSYLSAVAAYTELSLAQTPEEFLRAGDLMGPALNFFYTDNSGNIGFYHAGKFPIRPADIDPRFPTPGTGEYEWLGFLANEDKPQIINPASGLIVNWNNKPAPGWANGDLGSIFTWAGWSIDHRSVNLDRLMRERAPHTRETLEQIIYEIAEAELEAFAVKGFLLEALANATDPQLVQARQLLADWDNLRADVDRDGYYDTPAVALFQEWWYHVNKNTFSDEIGPFWDGFYRHGGLLYNYGGYSFIVRTVIGDEAAVPVNNDYYNGRGWQNVYVESLQEAIAELTKKYGTSDMNRWRKEIKTMPFPSTLIAGTPSSFDGVPDIKYLDRGSQNHVVEMTYPVVTGKNIVPPGQSGFINKDGLRHKHFADQLDMFVNWEYKDMLLKRGDVLVNSKSTEILIYKPKYKK